MSSRRAYAAWIVVCVVWSTTYLGIRIAIETMPPFVMSGLRWTPAGAVILAALKARGEYLPPRSQWGALTFPARTTAAYVYLTLAGSIAAFSAYLYALKHLPVSFVSLYAYINPIVAVLLGTLLLKEPLSWRIAVAGGIVLAGMSLVRK